MIKLRTFLFSFFLLQMGISHADSLEVEVKREGGGYINLSAREDESSRYCNIYTGALRITSLQYGNSDRPNKIEFTSASGDILVFDFNTDKMN
ncbi:hypothetical protein [Yersinia enterocolitica]|nr:hypothetical protein [Yersinia enterocolitica]CNG67695.1 Uncharacterised protein [Yersinia enterocolitica]CRY23435.1 Uncharacterised protein [Yersinia enterocolitica]HDL8512324.1 hypothetical protein [Yersinia enterocolitica]